MNKQQFQHLLQEQGIQPPPLPPDEILPPDADMEEYLAQVYLHCARVEKRLIRRERDRVFEVSVDERGKFRGVLRMEVEPTIRAEEEADEAE